MQYLGELAALGTAACWSFTALFFSEAGKRIGSFRVNQIRLLFAVIIYTVILLFSTGRLFPADLNSDQFWLLTLSGVIGLVIGDSAGFKALVMIGPRLTTLLWSTAPIMATLIAWALLDETLAFSDYIGITLTVAGVAWVATERGTEKNKVQDDHPDSGTKIRGILLGLLAAFGQAAGLVLSKQAMLYAGGTIDPMPASYIRLLTSLAVIWILSSLRGKLLDTIKEMRNPTGMLYTLGGAVMGPYLGVWLSLVAVASIPAGVASTLNATTPILIIPIVRIIYRERISRRALIGVLVAFLGILLLFAGI